MEDNINQMEEENSTLREEIVKLDDKNLCLERINTCLKRQLKEEHKRRDELQREYDKLKVVLDEVIEKEKISNVALKKSMTEKRMLITKIEAAELEAQEVASLKEQLKIATSERSESTKKLAELTKMWDEEYNRCDSLQKTVKELQGIIENLQNICESRENTIQILREKYRELTDENAELKLLIDTNAGFSVNRDSTFPNLDTESYCMHDTTGCGSNSMAHQVSLFDELRASGFSGTHDEDDSTNHQLEDRMHWYEAEINKLLQQTERLFEQLVSIYGEERFRLCVTQNIDYIECSEKTKDFETLKQRIQILVDVFTEIPSKIANIGTQLEADSSMTGKLNEVFNFHVNLEHALNTNNNGIVHTSTIDKNTHEENSPALLVIRESSPRLATERQDSPRKNKVTSERNLKRRDNVSGKRYTRQRVLDFMNANVECHGTMIPGYRRSKSESNLIAEKIHSPFLHRSFNVPTMPLLPEKMDEVVETREKIINESTSKEKEPKNIEETIELKGVQNLTSWYEYKFGGTYRSLSNSTDSSICSMASRHHSLLGLEDSSLDEPFQQHCELCTVRLVPARLRTSMSKTPSILGKKCINGAQKICQSNDSRTDKRSMSPLQRLSSCGIYETTAMFSTPIYADSKDKNFWMHKNDTTQRTKNMRGNSCRSLIRQFVNLDISSETNDLLNSQNECHSDDVTYNEYVESGNFTDTQSVVSVSNKSSSYSSYKSNTLERSNHAFTIDENHQESSISDEMQFFVTAAEGPKDCTDTAEELQDILGKMESSPEENNNVLQSNDLYTSSLMKSNVLLSDFSRNFNEILNDTSKHETVNLEKSTSAVFHTPANSVLSWPMFILCSLVLILGYYLIDIISPCTCSKASCTWYSYEEIFNQYFSTRSKIPPPI